MPEPWEDYSGWLQQERVAAAGRGLVSAGRPRGSGGAGRHMGRAYRFWAIALLASVGLLLVGLAAAGEEVGSLIIMVVALLAFAGALIALMVGVGKLMGRFQRKGP